MKGLVIGMWMLTALSAGACTYDHPSIYDPVSYNAWTDGDGNVHIDPDPGAVDPETIPGVIGHLFHTRQAAREDQAASETPDQIEAWSKEFSACLNRISAANLHEDCNKKASEAEAAVAANPIPEDSREQARHNPALADQLGCRPRPDPKGPTPDWHPDSRPFC